MTVTIAEVMHRFADHYIQQYPLSPDQLKLIYDIKACRTNKLGDHVTACTNCGDIKVHSPGQDIDLQARGHTLRGQVRRPR